MSVITIGLLVLVLCFLGTQAGFCPGHQVKCRESQTCCQAQTPAGYACCPYQNATCCADKLHCCPQNTDCDSAHSRCIPRVIPDMVSWRNIDSYLYSYDADINEVVNQVCPGSTQSCPDAYTCCEMASGDYGCCPMQGAVCCSDKVHCCPSGTTCDVEHGGCRM